MGECDGPGGGEDLETAFMGKRRLGGYFHTSLQLSFSLTVSRDTREEEDEEDEDEEESGRGSTEHI